MFTFGLQKRDAYVVRRLQKDINCREYNLTSSTNDAKYLGVRSDDLFDELRSLGIVPNKTFKLHPSVVPRKHLNHFVRGYMDGDGSVGCYWGKSGYKCGYKFQFLLLGRQAVMREISRRINAKLKIHTWVGKAKPGLYKLALTRNEEYKPLKEWLYKDAHFSLKRKKKAFDEIVAVLDFYEAVESTTDHYYKTKENFRSHSIKTGNGG